MVKSDGVDKDAIVTTSELADIVGLTPRRLQQLVREGILQTVETGRFLLGDAVQAYITYLKDDQKSDEEQKLDIEKKRAEVKLKKARARKEELQTAELDGKMYRAEDVRAITDDMVYSIKSQIMALPARLAAQVAHEVNPAACRTIIKHETVALLNELSKYEFNPEFYKERVENRRKLELKFLQDQVSEDE